MNLYDAHGVAERGVFDDLTGFATRLCEARFALVTLIEGDRQHFLGRTGTTLEGTATDDSFCRHAIAAGEAIEVPDTLADPRFADNPLVTGDLHIRFYAGSPLRTDDGDILGTLCVLHDEPHPGLTPLQREGLAVLARAAMDRLADRRQARERGEAVSRTERRLAESELRFRTLADAMPQMVWSTLPDGFHDYYNARWYEFTGVPEGSTDGEGWNGMFHPDDQPIAWSRWRHSLETGEPYQIEYRLRHRDGGWRWVLGRAVALRDDADRIVRWFGTCTDIHEQKLAMEEREIISQELSHRIKNIFAVIAGLIQFAARARPEFAPIATDLRQRVMALGRAHDFVRPHSAQSRPSAQQDSMKGLLGELFKPYAGPAAPRVTVEGEDVMIDDRSATPLALLFHELATNASKYGALSVEGGHVTVAISREGEDVLLRWQETGGPRVTAAPDGPGGFGSQLIELSAVRQMGGTVTRDWREDGLVATIRIPLGSIRR
ncbi:sensor histidine kinase [Sphingomonas metalli]|nr:PAS domain-containing protein [Sphingomonas metalli]